MEAPSSLSTELLDAVRDHLDKGLFKEALELPEDNKYAACLKDNCWDLIPHLLGRLQDDTIITWPALQRCCERLLLVVAERANPEEVLLELIEQAEVAKNDAQFIATLLPLQIVLKRSLRKRGRSLEWCLNTLSSYVEQLPLPDNDNLAEDEEMLLMDCDVNARRILKVYAELPTFYSHFIQEFCKNQPKRSKPKDVLVCFLIDLLGKPLALLDMANGEKTKSQCRVQAESIFKDICELEPNILRFLDYTSVKCNPKVKNLKSGVYEDAPDDIFLLDEKLKPASLAVLFYLLLAEKLSAPMMPQVYNQQYVFQETIQLSAFLLGQEASMLRRKGLHLTQAILELLPAGASAALLSSPAHPALARGLSTTAVYCPAAPLRKLAVCILKDYILKFNDEGRYLLIVNLLPTVEHSGLTGYIITLYKEALMDALHGEKDRIFWFKDQRLQAVLQLGCKLSEGAETDLVDSADRIVSALNLLRFLSIRDTENVTGVWNFLPTLQNSFLMPLREGINMSRAHYEVKLLEISEGSLDGHMDGPSVSVSVGGSMVDKLPPQNQKEVVNSAINALHLIDSLLCRLQECVNLHKV